MSRSFERKRANAAYGIGTASVIGGLLALSLAVWAFRPPLIDEASLCPVDRPIAGHTLVIVDRTDQWDPQIAETLTAMIEDAQKETQRFEKFSIVSLDQQMSTHPLFSICNPGEPTFLTDIYRGRRYTKNDFDAKFVGAAEEVVAQVREPSEARTSPIVEYVQRMLRRDDFDASVPNRHLVLMSDMRQNSEQLNVYADNGTAELAPLVARELGDAARDVAFEVYFVDHGHDYNVSEEAIHTAWNDAFAQIPAQYEWRRLD
jgi:hypothetical protein